MNDRQLPEGARINLQRRDFLKMNAVGIGAVTLGTVPLIRLTTSRQTQPSMTVLVHGTSARDFGTWYKPADRMHRYLKSTVFPDVYSESDYFHWSGGLDPQDRMIGAANLVAWCNNHPARRLRLIAHSHGCTVVSQAINRGLKAHQIIYLSPLVMTNDAGGRAASAFNPGAPRPDDIPNMANVDMKIIFNIHASNDSMVTDAALANQNFQNTRVARFERELICAPDGHGQSYSVDNWRAKHIKGFVSPQTAALIAARL